MILKDYEIYRDLQNHSALPLFPSTGLLISSIRNEKLFLLPEVEQVSSFGISGCCV